MDFKTEIESAINLQPRDKVKIDGNWWVITRHTYVDTCVVQLQLRSELDDMLSALATSPSMRFEVVHP